MPTALNVLCLLQMRERRVEQISVDADFDEREVAAARCCSQLSPSARKDGAVEHYPIRG